MVDSVWDRTKPMTSLQWTLTNPIQQDVYLGVKAGEARLFMTDGCATDQRLTYKTEFLSFRVKNSAGTDISDSWGSTTLMENGSYYPGGGGWMWFFKMAAGTYKIYQSINYSAHTSGQLSFGVMAWASQQEVTLKQII